MLTIRQVVSLVPSLSQLFNVSYRKKNLGRAGYKAIKLSHHEARTDGKQLFTLAPIMINNGLFQSGINKAVYTSKLAQFPVGLLYKLLVYF